MKQLSLFLKNNTILLFILLSILLSHASATDNPDVPLSNNESWTEKISTDLLQLFDERYCSPGTTTQSSFEDMLIFNQVRIPENGIEEAHITANLVNNPEYSLLSPYFSEYETDYEYGIISGWIRIENLTLLAREPSVLRIKTMLPTASSGNIIISPIQTSEPGHEGKINKTTDNWKTKLSTDILQLLDNSYLSPGQSMNDARELLTYTGELKTKENKSYLLVTAKTSPHYPDEHLDSYFTDVSIDHSYQVMSGWIPLENITTLAMQEGLTSLITQIPAYTSQIKSEGDILLNAAPYRAVTGLSGRGVKVGIISDGVDDLDEMIQAGELPDDVKVIKNSVGGEEGTAMLQIVHDIAPNASLIFHDRGTSQIEYIHAVDELIRQGCTIICDDITYVEPFFEDGYIAKNIRDRILSYGILYITSAGNFAQSHYQAPFHGYEKRGYFWHDFEGLNNSRDMSFEIPPGTAGHVILQWDDPMGSSANNYDLFLYDSNGHEIGRSVNIQDGNDDPMEWVRFINKNTEPIHLKIGVVQAAADDKILEIYVLPLGGVHISMDPNTMDDSIFGQQVVPEAITVAATYNSSSSPMPEPYSSRGPVTIRFPEYEIREKPDIGAPDRVTIQSSMGMTGIFAGTSAASPHIAGLCALILEQNPQFTYNEVKNILLKSATGTNNTWNKNIGHGIPDAYIFENIISELKFSTNTSYHELKQIDYSPREQENPEKVTLYPGWNMISIPQPINSGSNTGKIFSSINTAGHTIWKYDADDRRWISIKEDIILSQMDVIWIYTNEKSDINLDYQDNQLNYTSRSLYPGWNPLGIPGQTPVPARILLAPIGNNWTYILVYDSQTQSYRPSIINGGNGIYSPERLLYPTEGFWIYMNSQAVLMP